MILPPVTALNIDWPKDALSEWSVLNKRIRRMGEDVGRNDAYDEVKQQLQWMARNADFKELPNLLRRRVAARVLTELWIEDKEWQQRLLKRKLVDLLVASQKPRLGRLPLLQLIGLYFSKFDLLDNIEPGLRDCLEQHLKDQIRLLPPIPGESLVKDVFATLREEGFWLLSINGPRILAEKSNAVDVELSDAFDQRGLLGYDAGRFGDLCRARFYLDTLKQLRIGEWHTVMDQLLEPIIYQAPYEGDRTIGHEAISILIDRAGEDPGEAWQNFILHIAGDPRITSQAPSYRRWWMPLGEERVNKVRGWLSREDLRLFLQALEQYGKETRNAELQRMFPERKQFLEGLFKLRIIRNTRLMLGWKAQESVKRILGKEVRTSFAKLGTEMADKAVIYLDCGQFHVVEGSHNFKFWVYLAPPSRMLLNYEKTSFSHFNLTNNIPAEYTDTYPDLNYEDVTHNGVWQSKVINFLARNGIKLDIEQVMFQKDYTDYVRRFGMPVVAPTPARNIGKEDKVTEPKHVHPVSVSMEVLNDVVNEKIIGLNRDSCAILSYLYLHPGAVASEISAGTDIKIYVVNTRLLHELMKFVESRSGSGWFLNQRTQVLIELSLSEF